MKAHAETNLINKKLKKFNKIYPWFDAISCDLLFFIAIDTLFFSIVKEFNPAQIAMLTTISSIITIIMQVPLINLIKRLGNTKSIRLGTFVLLISACLITFSPSYIGVAIGRILYELSFIFRSMVTISLKNNLIYQNRADDYKKMLNKGYTIYAAITLIIALISGPIFNINTFLPMYLCIIFCVIGFIMSFEMFDISETHKIESDEKEQIENTKAKISIIIIFILISYTLVYGLIINGQGNSKLLIQYDLTENFEISTVAMYLSIIVVVSRVARLFANLIFEKVYNKFLNKFHMFIAVMLVLAFVLVICGHFIVEPLIFKFTVMAAGFCIILMIRDPYRIFMNDLVLSNTKHNEQQVVFAYMELGRKIVTAGISILITAMLTKLSLIYVILLMLILAVAHCFVARKLYKLIK